MLLRFSQSALLATGFVAGAVTGLLLGTRTAVLQPIADTFLAALQAVGLPVALLALLSAVVLFSMERLTWLGGRSLCWYLGTSLAASLLSILVAHALSVGSDVGPLPTGGAANAAAQSHAGSPILIDVKTALQGPFPHLVFWGLFLVLLVRSLLRARPVAEIGLGLSLLEEGTRIAYRILAWLMRLAPVGVFALVAISFSKMQTTSVSRLLVVLVAVYISQVIIILGCALILSLTSLGPRAFLTGVWEALFTAYATGSSAASAPVEIVAAEKNLRLDRRLVGVVLPLGLAINKLGTAAYLAAVIYFAARGAGVEPSSAALLWLTLLTCAASILTPPVSGGATAALSLISSVAGIPMSAIMVAATIPLMGKLNTPLNALGRLIAVVVLAPQKKEQLSAREREFESEQKHCS